MKVRYFVAAFRGKVRTVTVSYLGVNAAAVSATRSILGAHRKWVKGRIGEGWPSGEKRG